MAAVPGLKVAGLRGPQFSDEVVSVTGIIDSEGNRWMVTSPHDTVGGMDLESQSAVLSRLARAHDAHTIPFDVPRPIGFLRTKDGLRVMVHNDLGSRFMTDSDFDDPHLLPASLARSLASLHNLDPVIYTGIDLPAYTADEVRARHMALLDEAASATVIPANLWNRWEMALEDAALWRFTTVPVHGDLTTTAITVDDGSVMALTGFSSAHVGDPALDVSWVLAQASPAFLDRFRQEYSSTRTHIDVHLLTRAQLSSELAIIRWLLHGVHAEDTEIVDSARQMLSEMADDIGDDQLVRPQRDLHPIAEPSDAPLKSEDPTSGEAHEHTVDHKDASAWDAADVDDSDGVPTHPINYDFSEENTPTVNIPLSDDADPDALVEDTVDPKADDAPWSPTQESDGLSSGYQDPHS
ncbi:MAG: phosphotransferase [Actinobacteria bacterium]|nr:MAG: phosphotransferase [Actinomycetota bacterium]